MAVEVYVNTDELVELDLIVAAIGTPVATLIEDGAVDVALTVTTGTAGAGFAQKWKVTIPASTYDRKYRLLWTWTDASAARTKNEFFEIVTPLNTPEDLAIRYGWIYSGVGANKDRDEVVLAERLSRMVINAYTGVQFGRRVAETAIFGTGTDMLYLDDHIIAVRELWENNVLAIDNVSLVPTNEFGFEVEITETGYSIRLNVDYDISESQANLVTGTTGRFIEGYRYKVVGEFGWEYVPMDVAEAAAILTNDYICNDAAWRGRYINKVEIRDWKFTFERDAYRGTGSVFADQLLAAYRNDGMLII